MLSESSAVNQPTSIPPPRLEHPETSEVRQAGWRAAEQYLKSTDEESREALSRVLLAAVQEYQATHAASPIQEPEAQDMVNGVLNRIKPAIEGMRPKESSCSATRSFYEDVYRSVSLILAN
jgi:hypothetical protein